jgi:hypothetical protein
MSLEQTTIQNLLSAKPTTQPLEGRILLAPLLLEGKFNGWRYIETELRRL